MAASHLCQSFTFPRPEQNTVKSVLGVTDSWERGIGRARRKTEEGQSLMILEEFLNF